MNLVLPDSTARELKFTTAIESSNQIQNLFKLYREGAHKIDLSQTAFTKVFPHDEKSPAIFWIDDNQMIIRYPEYSKPYIHHFKDKCKYIECLSGIIYDKNDENFKLFPGDKIVVQPNKNIAPYTMDRVCYLRVCIGTCDSVWDQICG